MFISLCGADYNDAQSERESEFTVNERAIKTGTASAVIHERIDIASSSSFRLFFPFYDR